LRFPTHQAKSKNRISVTSSRWTEWIPFSRVINSKKNIVFFFILAADYCPKNVAIAGKMLCPT